MRDAWHHPAQSILQADGRKDLLPEIGSRGLGPEFLEPVELGSLERTLGSAGSRRMPRARQIARAHSKRAADR